MNAKLLPAQQLRRWTVVPHNTNIRLIVQDWATAALILVSAIAFFENRAAWGLSAWWNLPVALITIVLIGGIQHRFANLTHEAAHYTLFRNRFWNDLGSDLFVTYPIFGTLHAYRQHHAGHHLYPNDWEKDPNLLNGGRHKLFDKFPMEKAHFIYAYYLRFFWPPFLLRHLWDIIQVSSLASGIAPVELESRADKPQKLFFKFRIPSLLGMTWFLSMAGTMILGNNLKNPWIVFGGPALLTGLAYYVWSRLPDNLFFRPKTTSGYTFRHATAARIAWCAVLLCGFGWTRFFTGINLGAYFLLLWLLPLLTTFPYFMLLREVYQHANAGMGELDNSRVVYRVDPFTKWAVLCYGQDVHLVHHIYPNVPHTELMGLHEELKKVSARYRQEAPEVSGIFMRKEEARPNMLQAMNDPRYVDPVRESHAA